MSFFLEETAYSLKELAECLIGRGFWGGKGNPLTKGEGLGFELAAGFAFDEQEFAHMWKVRLGMGGCSGFGRRPWFNWRCLGTL